MPSSHLPNAVLDIERQTKTLVMLKKSGLHDAFGIILFFQISQHSDITIDALMRHIGINKTDRRNYERTRTGALRLAHGDRRSPGLRLVKVSRAAKPGLSGPPAYTFTLTAKGRRLMERLGKL